MDWAKLWRGTAFDPKWQVIARASGRPAGEVLAVFAAMLDIAMAAEPPGSVASFRTEEVAAALQFREPAVRAIFEAMRGRVHEDGRLTGWDRRQAQGGWDRTAAQRQARHRARQKEGAGASGAAEHRDVTLRNVTSRQSRVEEKRSESDHTGPRARSNLKVPSEDNLAELGALLRDAAGGALRRGAPRLQDLSPIIGLMGPGLGPPCDLHGHIVPAIRAASARAPRGAIASWAYYAGPITDYRDACLAGAPAANPLPGGAHDPARRPTRFETNIAGALTAAQEAAEQSRRERQRRAAGGA